jgi:hypothetical protein
MHALALLHGMHVLLSLASSPTINKPPVPINYITPSWASKHWFWRVGHLVYGPQILSLLCNMLGHSPCNLKIVSYNFIKSPMVWHWCLLQIIRFWQGKALIFCRAFLWVQEGLQTWVPPLDANEAIGEAKWTTWTSQKQLGTHLSPSPIHQTPYRVLSLVLASVFSSFLSGAKFWPQKIKRNILSQILVKFGQISQFHAILCHITKFLKIH